jgi:hypothetical protein
VPAQAHVADPAVDLGLHVRRKYGLTRLCAVILDHESLEVLARRAFLARVARQAITHRREVGDQDLDRPVPPPELGGEDIGRAQVLLVWLPGRSFREPIEPAADRQAADDRLKMAAALCLIAFPGADERMQSDGGKIQVVGRSARVDAHGHHPVADQSLSARRK